MRNRRNDIEERRVERPIVELWGRVATLSDEELLGLSESARADGSRSPRPRRRLRWPVAATAAALLVGSGLGFGVGSSVTPSGGAQANVAGLGFIPADGWRVTQTASIGDSGVARAVASNVPLEADDESSEVPVATLRKLPAKGIVIVARLFPRGDPLRDAGFPLRELPLRVSHAVPVDLPRALSGTTLVALRLRAAAGGYNVDTRVFVGPPLARYRLPLGPDLLAAVDEQLRRLVLAPTRVTLVVQPRIIENQSQRISIFGSVDSGRADQKVVVQFKACGLVPLQFRDAFETTTREGGGFSLADRQPFNLGVSGPFRAVSGDSVSAEVPVQQRAGVGLRALGSGRFQASASGTVSFWRRYVLLQRFDRARGVWVNVRRIVLADQPGGGGGAAPPFQTVVRIGVRSEPFRLPLRRGTSIRAVMPLSQTKPCYIAGVSEVRRT
jgi:hypothetical protein